MFDFDLIFDWDDTSRVEEEEDSGDDFLVCEMESLGYGWY